MRIYVASPTQGLPEHGYPASRGAVQELNCAIAMGLEIWRMNTRDSRFYKIS